MLVVVLCFRAHDCGGNLDRTSMWGAYLLLTREPLKHTQAKLKLVEKHEHEGTFSCAHLCPLECCLLALVTAVE